jgi:hypothetical protein
MNKLECLMDGIIAYTEYSQPSSDQYRFRNPLGLQMFCPHATFFKNCPTCRNGEIPTEHLYKASGHTIHRQYDKKTGLRIFNNHIQGYQSGLADLEIKCSGRSKSKVRETSSIKELMRSYCLPDGTASMVARFLRKALGDDTISETTPIGYFYEGEKETKCQKTLTTTSA